MGLQRWGKPARGGSNLVIDTVHEAGDKIPLSIYPSQRLLHKKGEQAPLELARWYRLGSLADEKE